MSDPQPNPVPGADLPWLRAFVGALTYTPLHTRDDLIRELSAIGAEMLDGDGPLGERARGRAAGIFRAIHDMLAQT